MTTTPVLPCVKKRAASAAIPELKASAASPFSIATRKNNVNGRRKSREDEEKGGGGRVEEGEVGRMESREVKSREEEVGGRVERRREEGE
jgi:hypothetical protein